MAIYQLDDLVPQIHDSVYVAASAEVIGDVHLAEGSSVWSGVVIRGDSDTIRIGKGSNVQDLAMLHADRGDNQQRDTDLRAITHHVDRQSLSLQRIMDGLVTAFDLIPFQVDEHVGQASS